MCPVFENRTFSALISVVDIAAGTNKFRLNRVIDEMRRLIEKYPGEYKDWARQGEAAAASTAQAGSEAKAKAPAAAELDQSSLPGASKVAVADAIASMVNGPAADFEAPGVHENVLSTVADTLPAAPAKGAAEPAIKEQAPVAQPAAENAPVPEVGERILKKSAAGVESSVTAPLKRPPTVPIPLPFSPRVTSPPTSSTSAVADHPTADPPNLTQPSWALATLPATTFNPAAAPTLSVTPPTPLTPRGPRARVESPLIDSPGHQPNSLDPVAELPTSGGDAVEDSASEPSPVIE